MFNNLLFLLSIFLITCFAWGFLRLGKTALITWVAFISLFANLFVLKQIHLFNLNATASDMFAVGGLFGLNLLQEYYGKESAKTAAWLSLASLLFFTLMTQIHLIYQPSEFDYTQAAYAQIFQNTPRIIMASLLTLFIVQQVDLRIYPLLRKRLPRIPVMLVSALSISISQTLDTALFTLLGLYGIVSQLLEIFMVSLIIKLITICCLPFMAQIGKKLIHGTHISNPDL